MTRSHTLRTLCASLIAFALVLALPLPARADGPNLLANGSFDSIVAPWALDYFDDDFGTVGWSPLDVAGSSSSGSLSLSNQSPENVYFAHVRVCLPAEEGKEYRFGFSSYVPAGQSPSGDVTSSVGFFPSTDCKHPSVGGENGPRQRDLGTWVESVVGPHTAPPGTRSIRLSMGVRKTESIPGAVMAHFDDAYLVVEEDEPEDPPPAPEPPPEGWFTDPTIPGFRFNVLITAGESSRTGNPEPTCLPETVCVSGAVPGRVEIFLRIVGPKPNGYLWPTLFKASTSRFDVWIDQKGTDVVKHYVLEAADPGGSELPGYFDREGFLP